MKKIIKALTALSVLSGVFFLASCQDVIFDEIRNEVKLDDAQIMGDVESIVRYTKDGTEYLFVQNGNIYKKDMLVPEHGWGKTNKPNTGAKFNIVSKLAADKDYLYARVTRINEDSDEGENIGVGTELWYSDDAGDTWNQITVNGNTLFNAAVSLFCTNDVNPDYREAYIRLYEYDSTKNAYKYKIYKLDGASANSVDAGAYDSTTETTRDYTKPYNDVISCVKFKGTTYFSDGNALTANDNYIYSSSGEYVYYSADGSSWEKVSESLTAVYSLAVTSDYLLIGTKDGIKHIKLDSTGIPEASTSSFANNAASALSSYYEVHTLLVEDPTQSEYNATRIYGTTTFEGSPSSTSATLENCGLWSYIPFRKAWNRE